MRRSTGSNYGFLFSVPWDPEGFCHVERGFIQGQAMHGGPQVQHIALSAEVFEIGGVLAGGINANVESRLRMLPMQ